MNDFFARRFQEARSQSFSSSLYQRQESSREYQKLEESIQALWDQIQQKLGEGDQALYRLEEVQNHRLSLEYDWVYQQAFRDCWYLLHWMGAFQAP